jgi:hypothetical protein
MASACSDPVCWEAPTGLAWYDSAWGTSPINDIWVGVSETSTTFVRSVRDDGSLAGLNNPGRFAVVPVSDQALVGISGDAAGHLSVITPGGAMYESTVGASGLWEPGAALDTSSTLRSLTGSDDGSLWAVGTDGLVAHYDGAAWSTRTLGIAALEGVWAGGNAVWVVGEAGAARQTDVTDFEALGPEATSLHGVFGLATGALWVVGDGGAWFAWDGSGWIQIATPTESTLRAVWADPDLGVWAGGDDGTLLFLSPGSGTAVAEELPPSAAGLHITTLHGARTWESSTGSSAPTLALWAGTSEGTALSRAETTQTVCE